jgi:hypothetical protein
MISRLGFFKFLSVVNLLIASFFLFIMLMTLLMMPSLTIILIYALVAGAVVIHSILSLSLQKSLVNPEVPLKSNTPGGIRIMGFMAMFYGVSLAFYGAGGLGQMNEVLDQTMQQMKQMQQMATQQAMPDRATMQKMLTGFLVFFLVHGICVIVNCALSFSLLKKWQKSKQDNNVEEQNND